jgi:hypothetical protein
MADSKITALTALTAADPANDMIPIVDVSDTPPASGNTKRISINNILACSPSATLASATITGDLTVDTSTLKVDSANNRVGIGTASPLNAVQVQGAGQATVTPTVTGDQSALSLIDSGFGTNSGGMLTFGSNVSNGYIGQVAIKSLLVNGTQNGTSDLVFFTRGAASDSTLSERYRIAVSGVATWSNVGGTSGTAMTLNATGLGVGVASPATKLHISDNTGSPAFRMNGAATANNGPFIEFYKNNVRKMLMGNESLLIGGGSTSDNFGFYNEGAFDFKWYINGTTPKMTLDSAGNVLLGTTNTDPTLNRVNGVVVRGNAGILMRTPSGFSEFGLSVTSGIHVYFTSDNGTARVYGGNISTNGSTTAYNTTSDYRLKESVQPLVGGLARVNALKPSVYKWKSDGSTGEGFLAHELAEIVPIAVTGEKDAVKKDGSIEAQGVDLSKLVPILVTAIQELTARVQTLEAK